MANTLAFGNSNQAQNRFFWRGAYNALTIYNPFDCVNLSGASYICLQTTTGNAPPNTLYWDTMATGSAVISVAGRTGAVVLSSADLSDGNTGTGAIVHAVNPAFSQGAATGSALTVGANSGACYVDGSSGTGGTGGFLCFTNDASTTTGYSGWLTNNAFWNGTTWIQPRGVGTSSTGLAVSNHKGFSFNRAAAVGTNNTAIAWTELANLSSAGVLTVAAGYQIAGAAASGKVLRGNGTNFVSASLAIADLAVGTSANLASIISDETGSGALVFGTSPTLATPTLNSPTLVTPSLGVATGTSLALGGGTALTTTNRTGTGNLVLATSPTLVTPTLGVASGTTLTGAGSGNVVTLLNSQGNLAAVTGNGVAQNLFTYTLPANTLGAGKGLRIKCWSAHSTGTASVSYTVTFGGSVIHSWTSTGQTMYVEELVFNNAGVTNAQTTGGYETDGNVQSNCATSTTAIATTAGVVINFTFSVAATDQVTPKMFVVELVQ